MWAVWRSLADCDIKYFCFSSVHVSCRCRWVVRASGGLSIFRVRSVVICGVLSSFQTRTSRSAPHQGVLRTERNASRQLNRGSYPRNKLNEVACSHRIRDQEIGRLFISSSLLIFVDKMAFIPQLGENRSRARGEGNRV